MQIKTMMIYHLISVKVATIKKTEHINCWQGCRETGALVHYWWECKMRQQLWQTV